VSKYDDIQRLSIYICVRRYQ